MEESKCAAVSGPSAQRFYRYHNGPPQRVQLTLERSDYVLLVVTAAQSVRREAAFYEEPAETALLLQAVLVRAGRWAYGKMNGAGLHPGLS